MGRGLYLHKKSLLKPEIRDFAVACAKLGPKSVIGGITALFHEMARQLKLENVLVKNWEAVAA